MKLEKLEKDIAMMEETLKKMEALTKEVEALDDQVDTVRHGLNSENSDHLNRPFQSHH